MLFCSSVFFEDEAFCNLEYIMQLGWKEERRGKWPNSSFSIEQMKKDIMKGPIFA